MKRSRRDREDNIVFPVYNNILGNTVECENCTGTGYIIGIDNITYKCSVCNGYGKVIIHTEI